MKQLRISQTVFLQDLQVIGLKTYKNKEIPLSTQISMSTILLLLTNILFLTNNTCQKERVLQWFSWKKERFSYGSHMDSIYLPFLVIIYASSEKKIKSWFQRIKRLENKWKEIKTCLDFRRIERPNGHCHSKWFWNQIANYGYRRRLGQIELWYD